MNTSLTAAELQLLSGLAAGRLTPTEIDSVLIHDLEQAGLVRKLQGQWRVSARGALMSMGEHSG